MTQKADRKRSESGQIRFIDNKCLDDEADRSRTDNEQKADRSPDATIKTKKTKDYKTIDNQQPTSSPPSQNLRLREFLLSCCSDRFVKYVFDSFSIEKVTESAKILRSSEGIRNPEAFLKKALNEGWGHQEAYIPDKEMPRQVPKPEKPVKKPYDEFAYKKTEFYRNLSAEDKVEFDKMSASN